jgi:hypothetical protein
MIEVPGLSSDITFVVYDDVSRNMDEPSLAKWANQSNVCLQCRHMTLLRVAMWHNFLTVWISNMRVAGPMKMQHVASKKVYVAPIKGRHVSNLIGCHVTIQIRPN